MPCPHIYSSTERLNSGTGNVASARWTRMQLVYGVGMSHDNGGWRMNVDRDSYSAGLRTGVNSVGLLARPTMSENIFFF